MWAYWGGSMCYYHRCLFAKSCTGFIVHIRIEQICQFRWVSHGYKKKKNASFLVTFLALWCSILGKKAMHGYGYLSGGVDGCL